MDHYSNFLMSYNDLTVGDIVSFKTDGKIKFGCIYNIYELLGVRPTITLFSPSDTCFLNTMTDIEIDSIECVKNPLLRSMLKEYSHNRDIKIGDYVKFQSTKIQFVGKLTHIERKGKAVLYNVKDPTTKSITSLYTAIRNQISKLTEEEITAFLIST